MTGAPGSRPGASALAPRERFASVDILRGLALFGVAVVNLVGEFRVSIFQQFLPQGPAPGWGERWVNGFIRYGLEMKAFALFSLLFGFGLALQYDRFARTGRPRYWLSRRLAVLLGFGLVHLLLIWNGDILVEYALAGLLALPLLAAPAWVLTAASALLLAAYLALPYLPPPVTWPQAAWLLAHIDEANRVLPIGSWHDVISFNLNELRYLLPLHVFVLPRTLGLFLLGALAWRLRIIQRAAVLRGRIAAAGAVALVVGAMASVRSPDGAATILLALGYAACTVALLEYAPGRRALRGFGAVGKMAFTNYMMQSLVAGWIFYGYGLGQFGRLDAPTVLALAVAIYVAQCWFSRWWLRRYRFGPLEWIWRTLTYGALQPMGRELNATELRNYL
ncbi:MAG: DUF418 domain-containing protein [Massilia sp.]